MVRHDLARQARRIRALELHADIAGDVGGYQREEELETLGERGPPFECEDCASEAEVFGFEHAGFEEVAVVAVEACEAAGESIGHFLARGEACDFLGDGHFSFGEVGVRSSLVEEGRYCAYVASMVILIIERVKWIYRT